MKKRLDDLLLQHEFFDTKSKAQAAIMVGDVKINGETITKAGFQLEFKPETQVEIKTMPFVSRGGFKLEKALKTFKINLKDRICLDAGASTGGFTDCMLQHGAKKVYAIDVGYGQLAWKLRNDPRVKTIERTNIRNCTPAEIYTGQDELPSFCTMDLSFISITKVLENIICLMNPAVVEIVALIKPQFEAGKDQVGKNGVVKDKDIHTKIIEDIVKFSSGLGLYTLNLTHSPIKGPAGNIEYLIHLSNENSINTRLEGHEKIQIQKVVEDAFLNL